MADSVLEVLEEKTWAEADDAKRKEVVAAVLSELTARGPHRFGDFHLAEHPLLALKDIGDAPWPATNAFALRGAVAIPQWCWPPEGGGRRPHVRGGAGYCAPWQQCGEFCGWSLS